MRSPTVSGDKIAFAFAGDLWSVPLAGGAATRLTSGTATADYPHFSPDGKWIAFTGTFEGNNDVYVVPSAGGVPKRITYDPTPDLVSGWTPDGSAILFTSSMLSGTDLPRLFTVSVNGGSPKALPLPSGSFGSYSADGKSIAYDPGMKWQKAWKRYRGGQTSKIWIADLADSSVTEIPRNNSNDTHPMWVGSKVYFLSDRKGPVTLFCFDRTTKKTSQLAPAEGFDMKSASAGPEGIVLEKLGEIQFYRFSTNKVEQVPISITGDFEEIRPQFKRADDIQGASISPSGSRVALQARGEIFTVPASKGDARDLTNTSGVAERGPAWSPDGKTIAYLSDEGGEYKMVLRNSDGRGEMKRLSLGDAPAYYYSPAWSPDSKKLLYADNRHQLWYLDVDTGKNTKIDETPFEDPTFRIGGSWSPDSKWVAYQRQLDNHLGAVFLYSLESAKSTMLTDGLSDSASPAFDRGGKYLYFVSSTNTGNGAAWLDLSSYRSRNKTSSVYVAVLRNDTPSPFLPESDEEKVDTPEAKPAKPDSFRIDLDGIGQRILALPMPDLNYLVLVAGPDQSVFALEMGPLATIFSAPRLTLWKFSMDSKSAMPFARNVTNLDITPNGQKILLATGPSWSIVPTAAPPAPGQGGLDLSGMTVKIDPRAEWRQIYHEVWRIERDFFYDPHFHGADLKALEARYEPFLENVMSRDDLNYLFEDMLGELSIGHMFINGGDIPNAEGAPGGLLGADYSVENNRFRLAKVYSGENWNPQLRAPLTQPGVNVVAGEYLLAVNGKDLTAKDDVYAAFEGLANKQVSIRVGKYPDGTGSREVIVVPVPSEAALRRVAWVEDNRRTVERMTQGRIGYMHIPDTNVGGWTNFNRSYYAQVGKEGMVVDERFNHGGQVDDYMTESMVRPLRSRWTARYGKDFSSPLSMIYGPKVLLINQYAGSGGDYFPWVFRKTGAGPLIGKRTWGGLVGILEFPTLVDGGSVTAPNIAFYNPNGTWDVENHGVDPDVDVDLDPAAWRKGHDTQLERAIEEVMKLLDKQPKSNIKKPAYVDKSKLPPG